MPIEAALTRLRGGDAAGALTMLEARAPADTDARYDAALGMVLLAENRPADALAALRNAATLGDSSPPTLLNLAIAEDRAGDAVRASGLMQELEQRLPDWDEPPLRLAESLRARGDAGAAEKAYARVLAVNPHREEALLALAGLLINRDDAIGAQPLLLHCCGIAPNRAEAWDTLGIALTNIGEPAPTEHSSRLRVAPPSHWIMRCAGSMQRSRRTSLKPTSRGLNWTARRIR
jgi:predicted Zn-dependent protease